MDSTHFFISFWLFNIHIPMYSSVVLFSYLFFLRYLCFFILFPTCYVFLVVPPHVLCNYISFCCHFRIIPTQSLSFKVATSTLVINFIVNVRTIIFTDLWIMVPCKIVNCRQQLGALLVSLYHTQLAKGEYKIFVWEHQKCVQSHFEAVSGVDWTTLLCCWSNKS